jgi:hypothetical protein
MQPINYPKVVKITSKIADYTPKVGKPQITVINKAIKPQKIAFLCLSVQFSQIWKKLVLAA